MATKTKLVIKNGYVADGASQITGSLNISAGITGSLLGTASNATLAADSDRLGNVGAASYALNTALTGFATTSSLTSYALNTAITGFATTSSLTSYALTTSTTGFATTGSNTFAGNQVFNGNVTINGTGSFTYLNVTYESASIIYSSGSNQFGDDTNDVQTLIGTIIMSGALQVTGSVTATSFSGNGAGLTGVTATAIFPTSAVTNLNSTDKFFVSQSANEFITYGNLLTDLAGTNLTVESTDSLTLSTTITGLTSVTSVTLSGSYVEAQTYTNIGNVSKTFANTGTFSVGTGDVIAVDPNTYPHNAIFVKYVLWNSTGTAYADMRAGTIMIVRDLAGTNYNIAESTTQDIGDTSLIDFTVSVAGTTNLVMDTTAYSQSITIKYEYTLI